MSTASLSACPRVKEASRFTAGSAVVYYIAASVLLLHLVTAGRYGYMGDNLYLPMRFFDGLTTEFFDVSCRLLFASAALLLDS